LSGSTGSLTISASDWHQGGLSRSPSGKYVSLTGIQAAAGVSPTASAFPTSYPRVAGKVSWDGSIDTTSTTFTYNGIPLAACTY